MKPLAILGRCETSRRMAPTDDDEWETWQLAWDMEPHSNTTRYFEIHTPNTWDNGTISELMNYPEWLARIVSEKWGGLVLSGPYVPGATVFPLDDVMKLPGMETGYLESSIAYMLAMAMLEKRPRVGIWGVDLTAMDEYGYQRPNLAYLIALARFSGMRVTVPPTSALHELSGLDGMAAPDFERSDMNRFQLEYLLGREIARGNRPAKMRADLRSSIWTDPPRYGYANLTDSHWAPLGAKVA
jgi:hypothetical protein